MEKLENPTSYDVSESTRDDSDRQQSAVAKNFTSVEPFIRSDSDSDDDDDDDADNKFLIRRGLRTPLYFNKPRLIPKDPMLPGAVAEKPDDAAADLVVAANRASTEAKVGTQTANTNNVLNGRGKLEILRDLTAGHEHAANGQNRISWKNLTNIFSLTVFVR